ncbi:MAG: GxxExxY protein [Phycisphaerae bacterium]|nr:GxxExxY protein [Phycisphaerae bacterium]
MSRTSDHDVALTRRIIGAAIEVHRELGPGLLESIYEEALIAEIRSRGMRVESQVRVPVSYKGLLLDGCYCIDLVVENAVVVELKATGRLLPVHEAQLLTYLRLLDHDVGLLINFNVVTLRDGIRRRVR